MKLKVITEIEAITDAEIIAALRTIRLPDSPRQPLVFPYPVGSIVRMTGDKFCEDHRGLLAVVKSHDFNDGTAQITSFDKDGDLCNCWTEAAQVSLVERPADA